jgi:hypothetical protein
VAGWDAELFAADLCAGPGRFLKIGGVEPRFLDQRIEIEEERLVLTELGKVDGDDVVVGRRVLSVEQDLLVQDVERPDLQLDLAAGHLFHVVMYFLHDLEYRVANSENPDRLSVEYACRLHRSRCGGNSAGEEASNEQPTCVRKPL